MLIKAVLFFEANTWCGFLNTITGGGGKESSLSWSSCSYFYSKVVSLSRSMSRHLQASLQRSLRRRRKSDEARGSQEEKDPPTHTQTKDQTVWDPRALRWVAGGSGTGCCQGRKLMCRRWLWTSNWPAFQLLDHFLPAAKSCYFIHLLTKNMQDSHI